MTKGYKKALVNVQQYKDMAAGRAFCALLEAKVDDLKDEFMNAEKDDLAGIQKAAQSFRDVLADISREIRASDN